MLIAMTRAVSPSLVDCELTHLVREPIDIRRASLQHSAYEETMRSLGATIVNVAPAPDLPDAVFIEDTAIVLDEVAVMTRPGAVSRRPESAAVAEVLAGYRPLRWLAAPATLDGGDVLRLGRTLYVGRSGRTNQAGIDQLAQHLLEWGYRVIGVAFTGCLHLKSAVTDLTDDLLLVNPSWVALDTFPGYDTLTSDPAEPHAANALRIGDTVVFPSEYPRTLDRLRHRGLNVVTTDCGELAKAEGAVTCCSLLFDAKGRV